MSINKIICTILMLLGSASSLMAQNELFLLNQSEEQNIFSDNHTFLTVHGQVYQQSNALTNSFVNKFINKGFIGDDLKEKQSVSGSENFFGAGYQFGVSMMWGPDSIFGTDRYGLMIGLSHHDDLSLRFDADLFNAVFYGNKMFAGASASLDNSGMRYQRFQQLNIGFFEKSTFSYVTLGIVNGNQFIDLGFDQASLYTAPNGSYVELTADGRFALSDTAKTAGLMMNGIGAALSFEVNIPFQFERRPDRPSYLRIGGENVGFTRWSNQTLSYSVDSTYNYQGFLVDDLAEFGDLNNQLDNVVDSLLPSPQVESQIMTTPGWLYLAWLSPLSDAFYYELQVRTKIYSYHLPALTGSLFYQPNKRWLVGFRATYGGYGGYTGPGCFRTGISLGANLGNHFTLHLSSDNIVGWINGSGYGRQALVRLGILF